MFGHTLAIEKAPWLPSSFPLVKRDWQLKKNHNKELEIRNGSDGSISKTLSLWPCLLQGIWQGGPKVKAGGIGGKQNRGVGFALYLGVET